MQILQQGMRARKDMFISMYRIGNFPRKNSKPPRKGVSRSNRLFSECLLPNEGTCFGMRISEESKNFKGKDSEKWSCDWNHPAESETALSSHASCMLQTNIHTHSCIPDGQQQQHNVVAEAEQYWQTLRPSIIKPCLLGMFCTRGLAAYTVLVPGLSIECNGRWEIREMNLCWWAWIDHDQNAKYVRVLLCIA